MSLVAYDSSNSESDDEIGNTDLNLPASKRPLVLPPANNLDLLSSVIKEKDNKSIKISVPLPSAFDSDDDEPAQKKAKTTTVKRGGLFALLPAPKNSAGISSQKILIPQSVTKKKTNVEKKKTKPKATSDDDDDDDDDETKGPLRFFTLEEKPQVQRSQEKQPSLGLRSINSRVNYHHSKSHIDDDQLAALEREAIQIQMEDNDEDRVFPYDEEIDDAPEVPVHVDQEMLQRLQGRRDRGKEEINFIDVKVAEEMPQGNELKRLTEESVNQPTKPKGNPTVQQRRKHQITYLAFQAKERELELKNQWAQNRLTRRQTQSKYGF